MLLFADVPEVSLGIHSRDVASLQEKKFVKLVEQTQIVKFNMTTDPFAVANQISSETH